jgi:hypothetical protein
MFWVLGISQKGKKRLLVALKNFVRHNDADEQPWLAMQSSPSAPKIIDYDKPLSRHRDVEWIYDSHAFTPPQARQNTITDYLSRKDPSTKSNKTISGTSTTKRSVNKN